MLPGRFSAPKQRRSRQQCGNSTREQPGWDARDHRQPYSGAVAQGNRYPPPLRVGQPEPQIMGTGRGKAPH